MLTEQLTKASEHLLEESSLADQITGFLPRQAQIELTDAIEHTLAENKILIAEAGTGTGKTFAYLIPALLSGKKIIISTGTKNLQDQLFNKDFPIIHDALGVAIDAALLKGRSNYLCIERLANTIESGSLTSLELVTELQSIREWSTYTKTGDKAEVNAIPEDSQIWSCNAIK